MSFMARVAQYPRSTLHQHTIHILITFNLHRHWYSVNTAWTLGRQSTSFPDTPWGVDQYDDWVSIKCWSRCQWSVDWGYWLTLHPRGSCDLQHSSGRIPQIATTSSWFAEMSACQCIIYVLYISTLRHTKWQNATNSRKVFRQALLVPVGVWVSLYGWGF